MGIFSDISRARDALCRGDLVGMPTETVYGLAAPISNEMGIRRIFEIKDRPFFDPLIVHIASFAQLDLVVQDFPPLAQRLSQAFWPGPLTIVLRRSEVVNPLICSGLPTVGVRMPRHSVALRLIRSVGEPLAAPSANKFGRTSPTSALHVRDEFPGLCVLDGGECRGGLESTVVEFQVETSEESGKECDVIEILRPGLVTREEIEQRTLGWPREVILRDRERSSAPGHLESHYVPKVPLVIFEGNAFDPEVACASLGIAGRRVAEIELGDEPRECARTLYAKLHEHSPESVDLLVVYRSDCQRGDAWEAIWNRLEKAASVTLEDDDC